MLEGLASGPEAVSKRCCLPISLKLEIACGWFNIL